MSIYDRLVPGEALRWGRLTKCWPWAATHDMDPMDVPPGVIVTRIADGRPPWEPLPDHIHFMRGGVVPDQAPQPVTLTAADFPLIRPSRARLSLLPWRRRK